MEQKEVRALLEQVSRGELDIDEAMLKLLDSMMKIKPEDMPERILEF